MGKPTEPQVSVTDTADIKVLSAAAPSWSVQTHTWWAGVLRSRIPIR